MLSLGGRHTSVLLVEDNPNDAELIKRALTKHHLSQIIERPSTEVEKEVLDGFKEAEGGNRFISSPTLKGIDRIPVFYIGMPSRNGRSNVVLVGEIGLRFLWLKVDKMVIGRTGQTVIVSSGGLIIAHLDRSYIDRSVAPVFQSALTGNEGVMQYRDPESGDVKFASYGPVGKPYSLTVFI